MWFLQIETLLGITLLAFIGFFLRKKKTVFGKEIPFHVILPLLEILLLLYIDYKIAVFYGIYTLGGYFLCLILQRKEAHRKFLFVFFILLSILPLVLSRITYDGFNTGILLFTIGIAYQMLKLIDGLYYVYYTKLPINPLGFINYMLFIPVFTAGPIFRYRDFMKTYENPKAVDLPEVEYVTKRIIRGFFKKVVLSQIALVIFYELLAATPCWYNSLAITLLSYLILYWDLSGYSDIAIGYGRFMGYEMPENFKQPWNAPTLTQFWRKWHASLSDWIREHVYVVVAKKDLGSFTSGVIAFVTMVIMGLWHGFTWPFIIGGIYNGLWLFLENVLHKTTLHKRKTNPIYFRFRCILTNFIFALNTLLFLVPTDQVLGVFLGFFKW